MKYLKPHTYLEKIMVGGAPHRYELSVLVKCEDNLVLGSISDPIYNQLITDPNDPSFNKRQTIVNLSFDTVKRNISAGKQPIELLIDLDKNKLASDVRVLVNAQHTIPNQDHDGSSTSHVGDPDG